MGFAKGSRKLTLASRATMPKINFLEPPRTHTFGQTTSQPVEPVSCHLGCTPYGRFTGTAAQMPWSVHVAHSINTTVTRVLVELFIPRLRFGPKHTNAADAAIRQGIDLFAVLANMRLADLGRGALIAA